MSVMFFWHVLGLVASITAIGRFSLLESCKQLRAGLPEFGELSTLLARLNKASGSRNPVFVLRSPLTLLDRDPLFLSVLVPPPGLLSSALFF